MTSKKNDINLNFHADSAIYSLSTFPERMKELKKSGSVTSLATKCDIGESLMRKYLTGTLPRVDKALQIAEATGVELKWLITGEGQKFKNDYTKQTIPLRGFASCGLKGWYNETDTSSQIQLPFSAKDPDAFAIITNGDSMKPEGIIENMYCIVAPNTNAKNGDVVYIETTEKNKTYSSIKRLIHKDEEWVQITGYLPAETDGKQQQYIDKRKPDTITKIHPVVCIFNKSPDMVANTQQTTATLSANTRLFKDVLNAFYNIYKELGLKRPVNGSLEASAYEETQNIATIAETLHEQKRLLEFIVFQEKNRLKNPPE
ncbi:MAG: hypothetical protein GY804_00730 [Alphaproteobacteria bacterium]|nr:hypothetical protein [Alphaproteobacteria bacterium]